MDHVKIIFNAYKEILSLLYDFNNHLLTKTCVDSAKNLLTRLEKHNIIPKYVYPSYTMMIKFRFENAEVFVQSDGGFFFSGWISGKNYDDYFTIDQIVEKLIGTPSA
jgi:hypothetical protein